MSIILRSRILKIFLSGLCLSFGSRAQEPFRDFQVWENFETEYNLNEKWLARFQEQVRFSENSTRFGYYYFDLGGMYKIRKNIRINLDYVLVQKRRLEGTFSTRHQYNLYLNFRKKTRRFTFFDRILTEGQVVDLNVSPEGRRLQDLYLRNKLSARYALTKRISPFISDEIYLRLDGRDYERAFNRNRLSAGILYKITQYWLFEIFYIFEHNFNVKLPEQNFILGFGISRSFYQ